MKMNRTPGVTKFCAEFTREDVEQAIRDYVGRGAGVAAPTFADVELDVYNGTAEVSWEEEETSGARNARILNEPLETDAAKVALAVENSQKPDSECERRFP